MPEVLLGPQLFAEFVPEIETVFEEMAKVGTTVYITQDGLASLETLTRWYDNHPGTPLLVHLRRTVLANRYREIYQKIAALLTSQRTDDSQHDFITRINTHRKQENDPLSGTTEQKFVVCDITNFYMRRAFYLLSKFSYGRLSDFLPYETFKNRILNPTKISTPTELKNALESAISSDYARRLQWDNTYDKGLQGCVQDVIDCIQAAQGSNMAAQGIEA